MDKQNHTGYSQVLEERASENGGAESVTTYTIGHDILAQYNALNGFLALLSDGHGSTRAVADNHGNIVQEYNYDAYGNAHGFDASQALTNLLYSGEQFNQVSGLQYLRARWYNPQTGTFNRLDPFAGNKLSPVTFHKYSYANLNPITYADPSGLIGLQQVMHVLGTISKMAVKTYNTGKSAYDAVQNGMRAVRLAQLGVKVIYNSIMNANNSLVRNSYVGATIGFLGGIAGGIFEYLYHAGGVFSGTSGAFTQLITTGMNILYNRAIYSGEINAGDRANIFYSILNMAVKGLLGAAYSRFSTIFDPNKLGPVLIDGTLGVILDFMVDSTTETMNANTQQTINILIQNQEEYERIMREINFN